MLKQNSDKRNSETRSRKDNSKVEDTMGGYYKSTGNQGILPQRHGKTKNEIQTIAEPHGDANCAREN